MTNNNEIYIKTQLFHNHIIANNPIETGKTGEIGNLGSIGSIGQTTVTGCTGYNGFIGDNGSKGAIGEQGLLGTKGPQGFIGDIGTYGTIGEKGLEGIVGTTGVTGMTGTSGPIGTSGSTGEVGSTWGTGEVGSRGIIGEVGPRGIIGEVGPRGVTGLKSIVSVTGFTGAVGKIGPRGDTGAIGPTGSTGYSIIGNTGDMGVKGPDGLRGATGVRGISGATGFLGELGPTGSNGSTGLLGNIGSIGMTGYDGPIGATGVYGFPGVTGFTGLAGSTGIMGVTGRNGTSGLIGVSGSTGSLGNTGAEGIINTFGFTGYNCLTSYTGVRGNIGYDGISGLGGSTGFIGCTGMTNDITGMNGIIGAVGSTGSNNPSGYIGTSGVAPTGPSSSSAGGVVGMPGKVGPTGSAGLTGSIYLPEIVLLSDATDLLTTVSNTSTITGKLVVTNEFLYPNNLPLVTSSEGIFIASSSTGQYVSVCITNSIYSSSNYGVNFTIQTSNCSYTAISMSSSGQYQCAVSSLLGIPYAHMSNDFGVSWIKTVLPVLTSNTFYISCAVSPTGKYVSVGGRQATIMISNDFGVSFSQSSRNDDLISLAINSSGISMNSILDGVIHRQDCNLPPFNITVFYTIPLGASTSQCISISPDGLSFGHVGAGGFSSCVSLDVSASFITRATPEVCRGVIHCGSVVYIYSSSNVWTTTNLGVSWVRFYTDSIHSIASTNDGSLLYILSKSGRVTSISATGVINDRGKLKKVIGSTLASFTTSVPFITTQSTITGTSLLNIPAGLWSISFGWGLSSTSSVGDGTNNHVTYGLSTSTIGFDKMKKNETYTIVFNDITSYETYAECITLSLLKTTSLYLNALINNNPAATSTGARMVNSYIRATLLDTPYPSDFN